MARRRSNLGFLGLFGRSEDLRQMDAAFRAADLHPAQVPDPVRLAAASLTRKWLGEEPPADAYGRSAVLIAFCALGPFAFARANGEAAAHQMAERMHDALARGSGLDCDLTLLSLHARLTSPETVDRFALSIETEE